MEKRVAILEEKLDELYRLFEALETDLQLAVNRIARLESQFKRLDGDIDRVRNEAFWVKADLERNLKRTCR